MDLNNIKSTLYEFLSYQKNKTLQNAANLCPAKNIYIYSFFYERQGVLFYS